MTLGSVVVPVNVAPVVRSRAGSVAFSGNVTALEVFLMSAAGHPLIRTIVLGDGTDELLRLFTTRGSPVLRRAVDRLSGILLDGWPQVDRRDVEPFAECMVRLAVSLAALPDSPAGLNAESISTLFAPYIEEILAAAKPARSA